MTLEQIVGAVQGELSRRKNRQSKKGEARIPGASAADHRGRFKPRRGNPREEGTKMFFVTSVTERDTMPENVGFDRTKLRAKTGELHTTEVEEECQGDVFIQEEEVSKAENSSIHTIQVHHHRATGIHLPTSYQIIKIKVAMLLYNLHNQSFSLILTPISTILNLAGTIIQNKTTIWIHGKG